MHIRKRTARLAAVVAAAGLAAGALSASAGATHVRAVGKVKSQAVHILIKDVSTSEGTEPAFVGPGGVGAKTLFTAHAGTPIVMTIVNQSKTLHSFTSKALGVNSIIIVGGTATVTFTPKKTGVVSWLCTPPCGNWVMTNDGYMKGFIKVVR